MAKKCGLRTVPLRMWRSFGLKMRTIGSAVFSSKKGAPGFKARDLHGKWSLRASITSGLAMTGCEIPSENMLPGADGLSGPLACLTQARFGVGWGAIGAAMECYQTALDYAKTRVQFKGRPIASHQLVQEKLVWMITEITKAQLLALHVGRLKDQKSCPARARLDVEK